MEDLDIMNDDFLGELGEILAGIPDEEIIKAMEKANYKATHPNIFTRFMRWVRYKLKIGIVEL